MGSSEYNTEKKTTDNNIYIPNLLAKEIIGENDPKKELNNINSKEKNDLNSEEKIIIGQNIGGENKNLNRYNDFAYLNNENRYNDNEIIISKNKNHQYNKNLFVAQTAEAIKMEITMQKKGLDYRKFKFNGITVVQNLRDYIPSKITRQELKDMVYNAFGGGLVDDMKYFIPGKTVTREQANAIIELIENYIKEDKNVKLENESILEGVNLTIDFVDLNKDIIKEKMFKGKSPSDIQLENILKNLSQGFNNVKILNIEFQ